MRWRGLLIVVALMSVPRAARPQGDPLGPEFRVNTYTTSAQSLSSVASDSSGNFVVVWTSFTQDGSNRGVFAQRYASSGLPLGPEFRVNTYTTSFQDFPSVASDSSGNFVVAWRSSAQNGGVFAQRYASSGLPLGPEFRVNTYTPSSQGYPSVASDSSGNFVVVWQSFAPPPGPGAAVFGQRYASSGSPLGPEFRVNTFNTGYQGLPSLASDSSGTFVVAWMSFSQDGSYFGVFGQRYDGAGTPLGPEFRVNTFTTGHQYFPRVASDPAGNFVVVWESVNQDGSGAGVFGQRYANTGAPLGPEFRVNTYTTNSQNRPAIGSDSSGNFVVVWESVNQDGSGAGVFGQRYASSGLPLGPEFRVNTYTTEVQHLPSVASDSSGNFVVVWRSYTQDGSDAGVFAQRYSQIVPVELMHFKVE
jgi:hypothetical protein